MSRKVPCLHFFPSDHIADTLHLSLEAQGCYVLILFHTWNRNCEAFKEKELVKLLHAFKTLLPLLLQLILLLSLFLLTLALPLFLALLLLLLSTLLIDFTPFQSFYVIVFHP